MQSFSNTVIDINLQTDQPESVQPNQTSGSSPAESPPRIPVKKKRPQPRIFLFTPEHIERSLGVKWRPRSQTSPIQDVRLDPVPKAVETREQKEDEAAAAARSAAEAKRTDEQKAQQAIEQTGIDEVLEQLIKLNQINFKIEAFTLATNGYWIKISFLNSIIAQNRDSFKLRLSEYCKCISMFNPNILYIYAKESSQQAFVDKVRDLLVKTQQEQETERKAAEAKAKKEQEEPQQLVNGDVSNTSFSQLAENGVIRNNSPLINNSRYRRIANRSYMEVAFAMNAGGSSVDGSRKYNKKS